MTIKKIKHVVIVMKKKYYTVSPWHDRYQLNYVSPYAYILL